MIPRRSTTIAALLLALPLLTACRGESTDAMAHTGHLVTFGPKIRLQNDSDVTILARYWVAKIDVREPSGFTEQRTHPHLELIVPPGEDTTVAAGRYMWTTGTLDAIVWVRLQPAIIDPTGPTTATPPRATPIGDPVWYELSRPGPYHILATGTAFPVPADLADDEPAMPIDSLAFIPADERTGPLIPLARSLWIEKHDGYFATPN